MPVSAAPNDPLFAYSWHLRNTGQAGGTAGVDLNVAGAWGFWSGRGVLVAVADDGVEWSHPDLAASRWTRPSSSPAPTDPNLSVGLPVATGLDSAGDNHGTSVAGIIAGTAGNATGSLGIAPDAQLVSYRTLGAGSASTAAVFTQALADGAAVVNGSYGPNSAFGADVPAFTALEAFVTSGRGGLGGLFVKSNGNSREEEGAPSPADGASDPMNASRFTIATAAIGNDGVVSSYSTPGGNLFIAGFGGESDGLLMSGQGVLTTDRVGPTSGYNSRPSPIGDYTGFNGTSAAAPTVTGVLALMLEANPNLGYRDVGEILALSARKNDPRAGTAGHDTLSRTPWLANAATNKDGGGWAFSHDYGFGLADAAAATRLAESWAWAPRTEANLVTAPAASFAGSGSVTTGAAWSRQFTIAQPTDAFTGFRVNRVEVTLDLTATVPSDLTVTLVSPGGTTIRLLTTTGNAFQEFPDGSLDYGTPDPLPGGAPIGLGSPGFWGEAGVGTWTLTVSTRDVAATVNAAEFSLFGDSAWADAGKTVAATDLRTVAFLTDGFAAAVAGNAGAASLARHGETVLNLAAMSAGAVLDLSNAGAATNRLGATAVTIADGAQVHHLLGGGGDDSFTGSAAADTLAGGWGKDLLIGLDGDDILRGGTGNDILIGNAGLDALFGGAGRDAAIFGSTKAAATVVRLEDGTVRVTTADGVDTLSSVELLVFTDGVRNIGPLKAKDFSGQGYADLLQRDASGALKVVPLHGNAAQGSALLPVVDPAAALEATGDLNGDGFADMSFRKADGTWIFSYGQGTAAPLTSDLGVMDSAWAVHGMPDLDGDGMGDIVLLHDTGFLAAMPSQAGGVAMLTMGPGVASPSDPGGQPIGVPSGWSLGGFGDFGGDGKADLLMRDPSGIWLVMTMNGTVATAAATAPLRSSDALLGLGDFNGDGKADILSAAPLSGQVTVSMMNGTAIAGQGALAAPDAAWSVRAIAAYSGDGRDDILWAKADGGLLLWEMNGAALQYAGAVATPDAGWTLIA